MAQADCRQDPHLHRAHLPHCHCIHGSRWLRRQEEHPLRRLGTEDKAGRGESFEAGGQGSGKEAASSTHFSPIDQIVSFYNRMPAHVSIHNLHVITRTHVYGHRTFSTVDLFVASRRGLPGKSWHTLPNQLGRFQRIGGPVMMHTAMMHTCTVIPEHDKPVRGSILQGLYDMLVRQSITASPADEARRGTLALGLAAETFHAIDDHLAAFDE